MNKFLLLLILPLSLHSQYSHVSQKGSLVIGVICKDGILMAADTRSSFAVDSLGKLIPYASVDGFKKIMPLGKFYIGFTGYSSFNNKHLTKIIEDFNKTYFGKDLIIDTYKDFKKYLYQKYGISDSDLKFNQFIMCGYEKNVPTIISFDTGYIKTQITIRNFPNRMFSYGGFKPYFDTLVLMRLTNPFDMKTTDIIQFVSDAFDLYSNSIEEKDVGGKTYILKINSNNAISELTNIKFRDYEKYEDFINDIKSKNIIPLYWRKWGEEYLKKVLNTPIN